MLSNKPQSSAKDSAAWSSCCADASAHRDGQILDFYCFDDRRSILKKRIGNQHLASFRLQDTIEMPSNPPENIVTLAARTALVCGMNNGAVDYFVKGQYQVARSIFSDTLKAAEPLVSFRETQAMDDEAPAIEFYSHMFQTSPVPEGKYHASGCTREGTLASLEGTFVYQRAILLQYADGGAHVPSIGNIMTVVLYNMAITLHVHGTTTFSLPKLKQASGFYSLALSSLALTGGGPNDSLSLPLVCYGAILNNLGEIHFHLGQYDHMKVVYNHLGEVLPRVVRARVFTPSEQSGLMCNTTGLKRPVLAAAA